MKTFLLVSVLTLARFSYAANGPAKLWLQLTEKSAKNFRDAKVREDKATLGEQKYVLKQFKASLHEWKENQAGRTGSMELKVICSLREPGDEVCEMTLDFYDANQTVLGTSGFLFEGKQRDAVFETLGTWRKLQGNLAEGREAFGCSGKENCPFSIIYNSKAESVQILVP